MNDKDYVPFNERRMRRFEEKLDLVLKQYSVTKEEGLCIHGKDNREMKKLILNAFENDTDDF